MPRRTSPTVPPTALAAAVSAQRGDRTQADVAAEIGVSQRTLSALESGATLSLATALAVAKWLGKSVEEVSELASKPARHPGEPS